MTTASLQLETRDPDVLILRLNRPAQLNAFTREGVQQFNEALDTISEDTRRRALIITGAGRGFCSGQDVGAADLRNRAGGSGLVERLFWQEQFSGMGERIRALPQVVIAAINGPCAGVGLSIALAADVRIIAHSARFLIAAIRLGLTAGESGISYHLPRLIGASRAFDIMLTGRPVESDEAERIGLCALRVGDANLMTEAEAYARRILIHSPFAVRHTKRVMWENLNAPSYKAAVELENRTQILASMTNDYTEATAAFTEKRVPNFKGI